MVLKTYCFSGFSNFSTCFGWDNGLECTLKESTTLKAALEAEMWLQDYNGGSYNLPESPVRGLYYTVNEHGGSRDVDGFVIANSRRDARKLIKELEDSYEVIGYKQEYSYE